MNNQTLKPVLQSRASVAQSQRLGSQRQNLGEGLTCPAGSGNIHHDVYGRPVTQNTLPLMDSACSQYLISCSKFMQYETNHRPHLPICAAGMRGASDMMGVGRDLIPQNLYNFGFDPTKSKDNQDMGNYRGQFERTYPWTPNNAPPQANFVMAKLTPYERLFQSWDLSNDGTDGAKAGR